MIIFLICKLFTLKYFEKSQFHKIDSFKLSLKILKEAHIITIPDAAFGPNGEGHLRFSFAGEPNNIKEGFKRLQKWAIKWKKENYKL